MSATVRPHRLARLPAWATHFLGYRATPPPKRPDYLIWLWSWIAAFGGISVLQAVFGHSHYFIERGVPSIIASYGASAVLVFGAIESPLAQPRALLGGHFIGCLTGLCITKLVHEVNGAERFLQLQWLAGSLSCATAIVFMQMTSTTHPPAGATALLAAVDADVRALGWYYIPVILLSSTLVLVVALLINNIQRRYPAFWIEPAVTIPAKVSPDLGGPEVNSQESGTPRTNTQVNSAEDVSAHPKETSSSPV